MGTSRYRIPDGVVVLNASMEPLGIVTVSRAVAYLMRERAYVVETVPGRVLRSASGEIPVPKVVAFRELVRVPYRWQDAPWSRRGLFDRDGHRCGYCGRKATTVDHIHPQSRGGRNTWENTIASCSSCNARKAARTPEEAGMPLLFEPRTVTMRDSLILAIAQTGADLHALGLAA